jgi:hypothetical protein
MSHDEGRQFIQTLNCFCNDQIDDRDVVQDADRLTVLVRLIGETNYRRAQEHERERCAKIAESVKWSVGAVVDFRSQRQSGAENEQGNQNS